VRNPNHVVGATIEIGYMYKITKPTAKMDLPPGTLIAKECIGVLRPVAPIHAHRGDQVIWTIINYTNTRIKPGVGVDRFGPSEPVSFIGSRSKPVDPNGGLEQIRSVVKKGAPLGAYIYKVLIDGRLALDPELDIES
jgi:hypothetical protein